MAYSKSKDNNILAELYSGLSTELLLEMVPSKANIERFIKKYKLDYDDEITGQAHTPEEAARIARHYINDWTPSLQQRIKALGGNPDIFAYPDIRSLYSMMHRVRSTASRSQLRQEVKLSQKDKHMPLVYETDTYAVFEPKTWEASRKYFGYPERESLLDGKKKQGATWCTTASREANGPGHFKRYVHTNKDRLIYIISKPTDDVFAYRGRNPTSNGFSDWILRLNKKDVVSTMKLYKMLPAGSRKQDYKTMLSAYIRDESYAVGYEYVEELRDIRNALINNLWFLFRDIHVGSQGFDFIKFNEADKAIDFLKFVAFVVYGKTELTGLRQSTPDSKLESMVKEEEEKIKKEKEKENTEIEPDPYTDALHGPEDDFDFGDIPDEYDNEPLEYEESYSPSKESKLIYETYEQLLLETPPTNINIERFIRRYYTDPRTGEPVTPDNEAEYEHSVPFAIRYLNNWTPRLQQIIKAAGGNPDIFSYKDIYALNDIINNAHSKTDRKKSYKKATGMPLVLETDKFLAFKPDTWEASRKYFGFPSRLSLLDGQSKKGATWCTTASVEANGPKFFDNYVRQNGNRLLYFIRKSDDELFAYRGEWYFQGHKALFNDYIQLIQGHHIYDYMKCYSMLPEKHPNRDEFFLRIWNGVQSAVKYASMYQRELRTQSNTMHASLMDFYADVNGVRSQGDSIYGNFLKYAEDFLQFVGFVVFGETTLPGVGQKESDAELKKLAYGIPRDEDEEEPPDHPGDEFLGNIQDEDEFEEAYRPSREELRLEAYKLLLETPATAANIERFVNKYYKKAIEDMVDMVRQSAERSINRAYKLRERGQMVDIPPPFDEQEARRVYIGTIERSVKDELEAWTPKIQQVIQARGGIADIFGYPNLEAMRAARHSASLSDTDLKKAYKKAQSSNIKKLWETDAYIAYTPLTWEASKKYFGYPERESLLDGEKKPGANWCTSADDHGKKFKDYVEDEKTRLFYFIRKKDDVLYAARGRDISMLTSDSIKEKKKNVLNTLDAYIAGYTTLRELTEKIYWFVSAMDYAGHYAWPLIECRSQNNQPKKLDALFFYLVSGKITAPKEYEDAFKDFMLKVLFGEI